MGHLKSDTHPLQMGLIAGAVGTVTLNVVTYADMAIRARQSSSMPAKAAGKLAEKTGMPLGNEEEATHRRQGLGALLGFATGLGVGAAYGLLRSRVHVPLPTASSDWARPPWPAATFR